MSLSYKLCFISLFTIIGKTNGQNNYFDGDYELDTDVEDPRIWRQKDDLSPHFWVQPSRERVKVNGQNVVCGGHQIIGYCSNWCPLRYTPDKIFAKQCQSINPVLRCCVRNTAPEADTGRDSGASCWNGLGVCDATCSPDTHSPKICDNCKDRVCCVKHQIVVAIPDKSELNPDYPANSDLRCASDSGLCLKLCLPPLTMVKDDEQECPSRLFCCVDRMKLLEANS